MRLNPSARRRRVASARARENQKDETYITETPNRLYGASSRLAIATLVAPAPSPAALALSPPPPPPPAASSFTCTNTDPLFPTETLRVVPYKRMSGWS